jgi:ABC-type Mn2+/Zn2+ transport system ATPase subunit
VDDDAALVRATDLALGYDGTAILRDVSLEVRAGEFWFLLGLNGTGKTTFLRAVLGLTPVRAGRIWLHPRLGGRERIGYVPQRSGLIATLPTTVRELVLLGLVGIRAGRRERERRLGGALAQVGLGEMAGRDYWSLSGGERQRALVARALVREPDLLLLDEPMSHLDPAAEETLLSFLADLHRSRGLTLLFVTHDLSTAHRHATHVALFARGTVTAGARDAVMSRENLARAYGPAGATLDPRPAGAEAPAPDGGGS